MGAVGSDTGQVVWGNGVVGGAAGAMVVGGGADWNGPEQGGTAKCNRVNV
jgi:hypothetical protein